MGYETINVMPVTPRIGAEIDGLTLAKPLSNRQVEELHQALAEHQVLFFRDQPLDVEGHKGPLFWTCTFTRTRPVRRGMPRSFPSMPTPIPSALPENIGIPTCHVTRNRRWAAFFTCTPCRLSAEIRCLRASMQPTTRCLRA
jgi:Taurine catabolism dioxygenase TauD, TfdA family